MSLLDVAVYQTLRAAGVRDLRLVRATRDESTADSVGREGFLCFRQVEFTRVVCGDVALSLSMRVAVTDAALGGAHRLGLSPFCQETHYSEANEPDVHKLVGLGPDHSLTLHARTLDQDALHMGGILIGDFTRLFVGSLVSKMLCENSFSAMENCIAYIVHSWDLVSMSFFVEVHNCYEMLVSSDRSGGACFANYDIMESSYEGAPSPHVKISDGYLFMTIRNQCGGCRFLTLVVVDAETQFVPGLEDFYARFTILALSLCYLIINQDSDEVSFRNCVSMIGHSHQFSVVEFTVDRDEPISKMGAVAKDPAEYEFIRWRFLECVTVTQRLDFMKLLKRLRTEGVGFSQETYRISMPDGRMRWIAVTGDSHHDDHLGSTIFSYLYEDISHLQQLESQVQETVKSMALASRLLGLHQYSLSDDGRFDIEKVDLLSELGYRLDRILGNLLDLVQPDDVEPLKSLPEGSTLTIRLREDVTGNWHWYTAICTNRQGNVSHGVLFSVHALTQLQSKMQITRDCLKFGSDTNAFAFWAISLKSDQGNRSVFETKTVRFLQELLDPSFVHLIQIEELTMLESPTTIEVRMKLPE
jgi:hypothetical protein